MVPKPFMLSVKVVVLDHEGRCLMLRRSTNSKANPGKWEFPGGKVDPGEAFDAALLREVTEETGLSVSLERVVGSAEYERPACRVAYLILEATIVAGDVRLSSEHDAFSWVARKDLLSLNMAGQFATFAQSYAKAATSSLQRTIG